jgi:alpha-tubulin suppressor-like RCC1 family protein
MLCWLCSAASAGVVKVVAGNGTTCAVMSNGGASCWGQVVLENEVDHATPFPIAGLTDVVDIAADGGQICATEKSGDVRCWTTGRLRSKGNAPIARITFVDLPVKGVAQFVQGSGSWCARLGDGTVMCDGRNEIGQGGNGSKKDNFTPTPVTGLANVAQLAGSAYASCAVLADHTATCWGYNHAGELGDGTTSDRYKPVALKLKNVAQIGLGTSHGCAIADGNVQCWGDNDYGQLGDGTTKAHRTPAIVKGIANAVALAVGAGSTCAIDDKSALWCWGIAAPGLEARNSPHKILDDIAQVSLGGHACALTKAGVVMCWGDNGNGELGDGTTKAHDTPSVVKP